ncbi:hypothetical protein HDU91_003768 [Kappamyces sp. JEL0680]|nr:hypothetical protein HDU91_003768 [Kappamyces sp. JEL0680]
MSRASALFLNHGGGPMPLLGDPGHASLIKMLTTTARAWLGKPAAIVLVTAHWETSQPTISANDSHPLLYDYYNFPKEAYQVQYNAPGSAKVAQQVQQALANKGISSTMDHKRGWDHGVFVPLKLVAPEETIPVVQISVLQSQNARELLAYGEALESLRNQNIAIVGSGMTFHNMQLLMNPSANARQANERFEGSLADIMVLPLEERKRKLEAWRSELPNALSCHPQGRAEHFSPLLVVAAAGGSDACRVEKIDCFTYSLSSYCFA